MIGTKLDLLINIDDLRVIKAFLPDGSEFGLLTATGKWGIKAHSLQLRKQINKLKRNKSIHFINSDDPIEIYHNYLVKNAKYNKTYRNKLAVLDANKMSNSETLINSKENIINESSTSQNSAKQAKDRLDNDKLDNIERLKKLKSFKTHNY